MSAISPKESQAPERTPSSTTNPNAPAPSMTHQEHPILNLQRTIGNQAVLRLLQAGSLPGEAAAPRGAGAAASHPRFTYNFANIPVSHAPVRGIQRKLTVNTPGDVFEQEADHVAEQVMRMPDPQTAASHATSPAVAGSAAGIQRACACGGSCDDCKKKKEEGKKHKPLQMKAAGPASLGGMEAPPIVHDVLRSSGQPLDAGTRSFMEPRFGHDFSKVRVHADAKAAESARAVNARAYTVGQNVVFGAGEHAPGTNEGQRLLGHELTHVVQQDGRSVVAIQRSPGTAKPGKPPKAHSLKVHIRIADVIQVVKDENISRYDDFTKTLPKELLKRLKDQVKARLSFLNNEGFQVSVEFGRFEQSDLKVPGNIQVWLVDELDDQETPSKIMKKLYGYSEKSGNKANDEFENILETGPGRDFREVNGLTPDQINDTVPGTSEPVFIKVPQIFFRDEINAYKKGKKEEAEIGMDQISATTSHELGHVLRSEPNAGHAPGTFNDAKQNFPPRLMDTISVRGAWGTSEGRAVPRLSSEPNDTLTKAQIESIAENLMAASGHSSEFDKKNAWDIVLEKLIIPNYGEGKVIRKFHRVNQNLQVWYDFKNLGYAEDETREMIKFLQGIEMSQANNKWKKK